MSANRTNGGGRCSRDQLPLVLIELGQTGFGSSVHVATLCDGDGGDLIARKAVDGAELLRRLLHERVDSRRNRRLFRRHSDSVGGN